jgi:hypothetical protein
MQWAFLLGASTQAPRSKRPSPQPDKTVTILYDGMEWTSDGDRLGLSTTVYILGGAVGVEAR